MFVVTIQLDCGGRNNRLRDGRPLMPVIFTLT